MNLNKENLHKYDIVIILCAGDPDKGTFFKEFDHNLKYLGGDTRKRAAIKIAREWKAEKIIVVGGGIEKDKGEDQENKVNGMKKFLTDADVDQKRIIRIISEADTLDNFRGIFKAFAESIEDQNKEIEKKKGKIASKLSKKEIGILTNFYHLPRALIFAKHTFGRVAFRAISAESIVQNGSISYLHYPARFLATIHSEINGLQDWEKGEYKNQWKEPKDWKGKCHDDDKNSLKSLLNNLIDS
jgi:hypothetical protein